MTDEKKEVKRTHIVVKVEPTLAQAFGQIAAANDRTKSVLIRDFIREYVKKNGQMKLDI